MVKRKIATDPAFRVPSKHWTTTHLMTDEVPVSCMATTVRVDTRDCWWIDSG